MSYMEMEVAVKNLSFSEGSIASEYGEHFAKTWQMVDENPDVDPDTVPLVEYGKAYKKANKLVDCFDPHWYVVNKIKLYKKIKAEGFDPEQKVRMTCSFYEDKFRIHNGHHRLSMLKHWKVEKVRILVRISASKKITKEVVEMTEEVTTKWQLKRLVLNEHQWYNSASISLERRAVPMGVIDEETPVYPWSHDGQQLVERRKILLYMIPVEELE